MATIAGILAFLVPICSLTVAWGALVQNRERARRELAVNLIYNFANGTNWATARAIAIAKQLPPDVIQNIGAEGSVSLPNVHYDAVIGILRTTFPEKELPSLPNNKARANDRTQSNGRNESFQITSEQSAFIRFLWLSWLNRLEGTLSAWIQGAAAMELMDSEFAPLIEGSSSELAKLAKIREGLPILEEFCRQQREGKRIRVAPLGLFPWPAKLRRLSRT